LARALQRLCPPLRHVAVAQSTLVSARPVAPPPVRAACRDGAAPQPLAVRDVPVAGANIDTEATTTPAMVVPTTMPVRAMPTEAAMTMTMTTPAVAVGDLMETGLGIGRAVSGRECRGWSEAQAERERGHGQNGHTRTSHVGGAPERIALREQGLFWLTSRRRCSSDLRAEPSAVRVSRRPRCRAGGHVGGSREGMREGRAPTPCRCVDGKLGDRQHPAWGEVLATAPQRPLQPPRTGPRTPDAPPPWNPCRSEPASSAAWPPHGLPSGRGTSRVRRP
jgi:hypothetical protein